MRSFSIKELERLCGVSAHVIRAWEKRFEILTPERQGNNVRLYTIADVMRLSNVALLLANGFRISRIAAMAADDINVKISQIKTTEVRQQKVVNRLVQYMFSYDTDRFDEELDDAVLSWGIDEVISRVIMPFLEKTALFSYSDTNIETHFVVTMIRRKLILGIERSAPVVMNGQSVLLYLPQGEHYDLVLLYLNYILKRQGYKIFYLGTDISIVNLDIAINRKRPDKLFTYVASKKGLPLRQYADILRTAHPKLSLCIVYADREMITPFADNRVYYRKYNLL